MSLEALLVRKTRGPTILLHDLRITVATGKPSNLSIETARITVAIGKPSNLVVETARITEAVELAGSRPTI